LQLLLGWRNVSLLLTVECDGQLLRMVAVVCVAGGKVLGLTRCTQQAKETFRM
jgi:hypothetical protein